MKISLYLLQIFLCLATLPVVVDLFGVGHSSFVERFESECIEFIPCYRIKSLTVRLRYFVY